MTDETIRLVNCIGFSQVQSSPDPSRLSPPSPHLVFETLLHSGTATLFYL